MEFQEKTIDKKTIFQGQLIDLEEHTVEIYNGQHAKREVIRHAPAVGILAIQNDRIVLVKQYRKAIEKPILEIPAGLVDPGEDLLQAAKRELAEETQLAANDWLELDSFYTSPGFLDEKITIFSSQDIYSLDQAPDQDDDEHIELYYLTHEQAHAAIAQGEICDMKTIYAINQWDIQRLTNEKGD